MTNYERIVNMSIDELAGLLEPFCRNTEGCGNCPLFDDCPEDGSASFADWLTKEAKPQK